MFLAQYKMMLGVDCKRIYKGTDYHRKRLKVLEQEKYIRRIGRVYIKLDDKGTRMVKKFGYDYSFACRREDYIERVKEIVRIASLTIDSNIKFVASWNLKEKEELTQKARIYIGKITYQGKESLVYYISKERDSIYTRYVIGDILKTKDSENIIIFMENMQILSKKTKLVFGKEETIIIEPTERNLLLMRRLENIDDYEIIKYIYPKKEILLSNSKMAKYMTEDNEYIIVMPFINTENLYRLNLFYRNNKKADRKITIMTLRENKEKVEQIIENKANIIEVDSFLDKIEELGQGM